MADYLASARRVLATLSAPAGPERVIPESSSELDSPPEEHVKLEAACRCAKWPFSHVHSREDRQRAIDAWNRDNRHKVEWIQ